MPVLSKFYGIIVRMYFKQGEHNPPHIHVIYGEYAAAIDFMEMKVLDGTFPERQLAQVYEWVSIHRDELIEIWKTQNFRKIAPLR